jgi:hypothetical protein
MDRVEKLLHDAFGNNRVRARREFFRIDPEKIKSALEIAEGVDVTPRHDILETSLPAVRMFSCKRSLRPCILMALPGPPSAMAVSICSM